MYQIMQRYIKIVKMHKKNKNYWTFMLKRTNIELTVKRNKKQEGNKRMKTVEPIKYMECFTESRDY